MTWDGVFTAACPACDRDVEWQVRPPESVYDPTGRDGERNTLVHFPPVIPCQACDGVAA